MDKIFMMEALDLAREAADRDEVPVGAVVVRDGKIIGRGYNLRESRASATAHAEVLAIEQACGAIGSWRLDECTLYVTMEPCPMCAGAIINSRIKKVVFGCKDAFAGCLGSVIDFNCYPFNHSFSIESGVCAEESKEILSKFFKDKRKLRDV